MTTTKKNVLRLNKSMIGSVVFVSDGKSLIKVEFSGDNTPYSAAGRYYLRTADEDREVAPEELKVFFEANKYRTKWEMDKSAAKADKVDRSAVKTFWQRAVEAGRLPKGKYTTPIIINRFGLVQDDYFTNAGEALFGNTHPISLKVGSMHYCIIDGSRIMHRCLRHIPTGLRSCHVGQFLPDRRWKVFSLGNLFP